jgi:hypothetical protein
MKLIVLALAIIVVACTEAPANEVKVPIEQRRAAAEAALAKTPVARTFDIGEHQLLMFNVPVKTIGGLVEYQRCMVWRDREFRSATLQCPSDTVDPSPLMGPEPEARYRP